MANKRDIQSSAGTSLTVTPLEGGANLLLSGKVELQEARGEDDDWTGLADPAERRKRQNRLHQRAWRKRKAAEAAARSGQTLAVRTASGSPDTPVRFVVSHRPAHHSFFPAVQSVPYADRLRSPGSSRKLIIEPLIPYRTPDGFLRPVPDFSTWFPLSPDHQLLPLMQYNVLRGMMILIGIMDYAHIIPFECSGLFEVAFVPASGKSAIPPGLHQTQFQKTTPHRGWIDLIPMSRMRDNLILTQHVWDEDDLCCDLLGGLFEGFDDMGLRGILLWGDPWDETAWEVTEGFAKKWTYLLTGCEALIASTNRWREKRGEEPLVVEV